MKTASLILLAVQAVGVLVALFGDVGFDVPGRFGLDIGHLLIIAAAEVVLLIVLAVLSIVSKKWWPTLSSLGIVGAGAALVFAFV